MSSYNSHNPDSDNILDADYRRQSFDALRLNYAFTLEGQPARCPCAKLRNRPPTFDRCAHDKEYQKFLCHSEWTEYLTFEGFSRTSLERLLSSTPEELAKSYMEARVNTTPEFEGSYNYIEYIHGAQVILTTDIVEPTEEFVESVRRALCQVDLRSQYEALEVVWEQFGYVWSQSVTIGGKLIAWQDLGPRRNAEETQQMMEDEAEDSISATLWGFGHLGTGPCVGFKIERNDDQSNSVDYSFHRSHLIVTGGNATTGAEDLWWGEWEKSIASNHLSWSVINHDHILPTYMLLDEDLRARVKVVMDDRLSRDCLVSGGLLSLKNLNTNLPLVWQKSHYGPDFAALVVTSPVEYTSIDRSLWRFIRQDPPSIFLSPSSEFHQTRKARNEDDYLHYGDFVYICAAIPPRGIRSEGEDSVYLHSGWDILANGTKGNFKILLGDMSESHAEIISAYWMIEPVARDNLGASATLPSKPSPIKIDDSAKDTRIRKNNQFRIRNCATNAFLCSHNENLAAHDSQDQLSPHESKKTFLIPDALIHDNMELWEFWGKHPVNAVFDGMRHNPVNQASFSFRELDGYFRPTFPIVVSGDRNNVPTSPPTKRRHVARIHLSPSTVNPDEVSRALAEPLEQNMTSTKLIRRGMPELRDAIMSNPSSSKLLIKLDENIMDKDLIAYFNTMSDFEVDTVQDEGLRGHSDGKVIMRARLNSKTIVTCDTDYLLEHWMTTNGVLVLWGRLGNKRFVRLTKKERKVVVPVLFHTHRLKIEEIRDQDLVRFAILSGNDLNDFKWEIRPPTDEELTRYFTKYVEKERALPFPPEESSPLSQIP